jgi:hypothetical protein
MPVLFSQNTGRVSAISDRVATGSFSLGNVYNGTGILSYSYHRTIITRIGLSAAGNYQFLHTIGNDVYMYVFGDRMGQITLHGLSFAAGCPASSSAASLPNVPWANHGFELLYSWYKVNRVAARRAPVIATIGLGTAFEGFVTSLTGDVQDPVHRTVQFQMTIATLPDS